MRCYTVFMTAMAKVNGETRVQAESESLAIEAARLCARDIDWEYHSLISDSQVNVDVIHVQEAE